MELLLLGFGDRKRHAQGRFAVLVHGGEKLHRRKAAGPGSFLA
jgi:hypothetical protein